MNKNQTKKTEFEIIYGGDAYSDNQINARVLGSALLSLSALIENSEKILNGEQTSPQVSIKAHKEGSFAVLVEACNVSLSTLNALGLAGAGAGAIWAVLDILKGREIGRAEIDESTNQAKLIVDDEEIHCSDDVQKLITSPIIRKELDKLVFQPLLTDESSTFSLSKDNKKIVLANQESSGNFKALASPVTKIKTTEAKQVNIHFSRPNFYGSNGWEIILLPEQTTVKATLNDDAFIERINQNITRLAKEDMFVVLLQVTTTEVNGSETKKSYSIERVIRHRVAEDKKII